MSRGDKPSADVTELLDDLDPQLRARLLALIDAPPLSMSSERGAVGGSSAFPLALTPAAMRAAIGETFTLEEVDAKAEEGRNLVAHASSVMIKGEHRLRLLPESRADVLARAQKNEDLQKLLQVEFSRDKAEFDEVTTDEVRRPSAWLRCFLKNEAGDLKQAPAEELRSAIAAREALALVPLSTDVPSVAEARRLLDLCEILEPLRILIGVTGGWEGSPRSDRFVGRKAEITALRTFVDELPSESALEAVGRTVSRIIGNVTRFVSAVGPGVFVLEGLGGLGKSSLIAKFVLDHALVQRNQFPFAYLDFDRASLQPRQPLQLLGEVARQIGLQYAAFADEISQLREKIQRALIDSSDGWRAAGECFAQFRDLMGNRVVGRSRAFLVVLDTMEVVQYDQRALDGVLSFVEQLFGEGFPELRVVATGRADIPELREGSSARQSGRHLKLGPLAADEARDMANRLGKALMDRAWRSEWALRLVGPPSATPERREPLTIRVGVELLRSVSDHAEREKLAKSIEEEGENAHDSFVATLYKRRLLDHVRDADARELAWRGLVLRRITRELARLIVLPQCKMDPARLDAAFDHLGQEVWIVDREGDVLKHRRELRARTLPLMRRHDEKAFDRMNEEAIKYYEARVRASASDVEAHAEWIYHRLLGGEAPESVDRDCSEKTQSALAQAAEDFALIAPAAAGYVEVRTAQTLLSPERIAALSPQLAYEHVARTALYLGEFSDVRTHPVLLHLARTHPLERLLSPEAMSAKLVIQIKTGQWNNDDEKRVEARGHWAEPYKFARKFKRARAASAYSLDEVEDGLRDEANSETTAELGPWAHQQRTQDLATARLFRLPDVDHFEERLRESWRGTSGFGIAEMRSQRTAVVFSRVHTLEAAQRWLATRKMLPDGLQPTVSTAELRALKSGDGQSQRQFERTIGPRLKKLGLVLGELIDPEAPPRRLADDIIWHNVEQFLYLLLELKSDSASRILRRFCAARDEDWVVPFGYAIGRVHMSQGILAEVRRRMRSYNQRGSVRKSSVPPMEPHDPVAVMQMADEAGDLRGIADVYVRSDGEGAGELERLLLQYDRWRRAISEMLGRERDHALPSTDRPSDRPPEPGPVRDASDSQKGRWGGRSERDGRRLTAVLGDSDRKSFFLVDLVVESTDGTALEGPVVFHLHDTYPKSVIHVRRIRSARWARLEEVTSTGVYTVGVQVKDGRGRWTGLEFDLAELPNLPKRFLSL